MLLGNYQVLNRSPGRFLSGSELAGNRGNWNTSGAQRNKFISTTYSQRSAIPSGYQPPGCWTIAQKTGQIASRNELLGDGELVITSLAGGRNADAALTGSGDISSATGNLILSAVAALTGSGTLTASMVGSLNAVAALVGSGDISGALGAITQIVAALTGTGNLTGTNSGPANMQANIIVTGDLLTTANVAEAIWNALAASFNEPGSMGELLNSSGAASNPWSELLANNNDPDTFGQRVQQLLTLTKFIGLK